MRERKRIGLRIFAAFLASCVVVLASSGPASAAGSDDPTPYSVTGEGITLPGNQVFGNNGHVNIKAPGSSWRDLHFEDKCIKRTDAECAGDRHDAAQYIGKNFIPWSAFGLKSPFCVTWVQIDGAPNYNEHYGEGGQKPVCVGDTSKTEVVASAPTFVDACGVTDDNYTIPAKEGVEYLIDEVVKLANQYSGTGTVKITARALEGFALKGDTMWTTMFTNTACPPPPVVKVSVPATPGVQDPCGIGNATWNKPTDTDQLTWRLVNGLLTVSTKEGFVFGDGTTIYSFGIAPDSGGACPELNTEVLPTAATFVDICGTKSDTYTVPFTKGAVYKVDGSVVVAGTYPGLGTVTVIAEATTGYLLKGAATWTFVFKDEACPVVMPEKPKPTREETSSTSYRCGDDFQVIHRTVVLTDWVPDEVTRTWIKKMKTKTSKERVSVEVTPCPTGGAKEPRVDKAGVLPDAGGPVSLMSILVGGILLLFGATLVGASRGSRGQHRLTS